MPEGVERCLEDRPYHGMLTRVKSEMGDLRQNNKGEGLAGLMSLALKHPEYNDLYRFFNVGDEDLAKLGLRGDEVAEARQASIDFLVKNDQSTVDRFEEFYER